MIMNNASDIIAEAVAEQLACGSSLEVAIDAIAVCAKRQAPRISPQSPEWDRVWRAHFEAYDRAIASVIRAYASRSAHGGARAECSHAPSLESDGSFTSLHQANR
jgi:hypothetical protein